MTTAILSSAASCWPVFGHDWAIQRLKRTLQPGSGDERAVRLSHAYLFLGAAQVGKSTVAKAFAMALLCPHGNEAPCQTCRSCRLFVQASHPDFRFVQPLARSDKELIVDRQRGELRGEQAEGLIRDVALKPMEGRRKVFLIQDMQHANTTFANKILKTLEEPPSHAVLLLTACHRAEVLPTILSRCQIMELRPLDYAEVVHALQAGWQASAADADLLARLSGGRLGWAVDQLHNPSRRAERKTHLEALWRLTNADRLERINFARALATDYDTQARFSLLETWTSWWRDVLLAQSDSSEACSNVDCQEQIAQHARIFRRKAVFAYLGTLKQIEGYLRHTVNTRLALDVLLLKLPSSKDRHS